jgi:hypothetical protein
LIAKSALDAKKLRGVVIDEEGHPIGGAVVAATLDGQIDPVVLSTAADGLFDFGTVESRTYFLRVRASGYMPTNKEERVPSFSQRGAILTLSRGQYSISGCVIEEDNTELKTGQRRPLNAELTLLNKGLVIDKAWSDEKSGAFSFENLIEGMYEVQASLICHSPRAWSGVVNDGNRNVRVDIEIPVIENCRAIGKCEVCLQTKEVYYCKFCHALICSDCRHKYPERIKAMIRRFFKSRGEQLDNDKFDSLVREELETPSKRAELDGCIGCFAT